MPAGWGEEAPRRIPRLGARAIPPAPTPPGPASRPNRLVQPPQPPQEMKLVVPNAQRINRGGMVLRELVEACRGHDYTDIIVLHEHRGEPGVSSLMGSR